MNFILNGEPVEVSGLSPNVTLLQWLREHRRLTGTKEGCAEGDCGACSVVIVDPGPPPVARAVDSCLVLLPMVEGLRVWTVEGLGRAEAPHLVQQAVADRLASQCGYCTPGIVMSLAEACHRTDLDSPWKLDDQMCGNLCRCTGYRPIREAAQEVAGACPTDGIRADLDHAQAPTGFEYQSGEDRWFAPDDWDALAEVVNAHPDHRFVCGGTDLALWITQRHEHYPCLVSVERLPGMKVLETDEDVHKIGGAVPLSDLETWANEYLPVLGRMLRYFGSRQIKHRGTIGGNLCNASPIGDIAPVLLALDATIVARGPDGERAIPVDDFFVDYRQTALKPDEVLARVEVPEPGDQAKLGSYKVSRRREMDISAVAGGFHITVEDGTVTAARLGFGGMAATPARATHLESALVGKPWTEATVEAAVDVLEQDFSPLDDHRGSAWYRLTVAKNLVRGFFAETASASFVPLSDRPLSTVMRDQP